MNENKTEIDLLLLDVLRGYSKIYFKGSVTALKKQTENDNLEHAIANLISKQYA